ncbi:Ornithine carbamoyltransferase 1 [Alloalcanivorax dieselolei B5]|uniref:Ornithine carbamoyltransferase n=1 Tax=Alcanivorax dieselolei (strain DSM 16502 / CGMCC 1.3690 / MCCC 1A00001 / B-5) TaxID=930169 RepID=K0CIG8_ALCDB|nr:ornithine carbamoyltransferase [Alloalcanivorax dieselolei]AFT71537.1 Ornithine carbamoyltransferase 1 [Alloalcanivorax dieselolei B5]GGJ90103.1 ornithine carbamoyltransferase [Alloalcanivorax dieselolei]
MTRHFLTLLDLTPEELGYLLQRAVELKTMQRTGQFHEPMRGKTLGMIFEKSSTRTRVSFEVAMTQFGGASIFLSSRDTQLGRGEPVEDSARVLSRMVDAVMIRTFDHGTVETFAQHSRVPVINALTDDFHPCQLLADMQTYVEHRGEIKGRKVVWVGDGNNMCNSYINAARQFDFQLVVACPEGFEPDAALMADNAGRVSVVRDPREAVAGAHLVTTDVWASMGQEQEQQERARHFAPYQVTPALMDLADEQALFMHCLPAHRGEEISHDMLDDPRSVVWDEAENRLHAQKALLEFLLHGQH